MCKSALFILEIYIKTKFTFLLVKNIDMPGWLKLL